MSIRLMTQVWEHSQHSGTPLILMLAIADHANDDGVCWPSLARLAKKARISTRQAKRVVKALEESGELSIERGAGRANTNVYVVTIKGDIDVKKVTFEAQKVTSRVIKGDTAMSPEPSITIIEPSEKQAQAPTANLPTESPTIDPAFVKAWEQNMSGAIGPMWAVQADEAIKEFGLHAMLKGISIAVANGKQRAGLRYVMGCARRECEGTQPQPSQNGTTTTQQPRVNYGAGASLNNLDNLERKLRANGILNDSPSTSGIQLPATDSRGNASQVRRISGTV